MSTNLFRLLPLLVGLTVLSLGPFARAGSEGAIAAPRADAAPALGPGDARLDEKLGKPALLDLVLRDEDGKDVSLRSLVDRPTILTLNYFRCGGICSPQLNGLARAIRYSNAKPGKDFRIITVSFDARDTAEIAARKRSAYLAEVKRPIAPADWRFLTGDAASTRELADSVGFGFKKVGNDFAHPGALMFLSPAGTVTRYMYGTSYLPADLEMAVSEAARGEAQPTIAKWLEYCFSSDPAGRGFLLSTTRVAGGLVFGAAIVFALILFVKGRRKHSVTAQRNP